ncbi:MAG: DMT family transporter, partial [Anaerolineales bacterium]
YILIGPRLSMLLMSLSPILASLGGWIFLHERLALIEICAIFITVGGVAWVILERNGGKKRPASETKQYFLGIVLGFAAAISQTIGLITSKIALVDGFPALTGTLIRVLSATLVIWTLTLLSGKINSTIISLKTQPTALKIIAGGALFGPVIGVTFSLLAVQNAPVGIATTLMALPPILLLPVGYFCFDEQFGWQAILGTFVAISGVAVLFLM